METTEPQQTMTFIQHHFPRTNHTLKATIQRTAVELLANNAFEDKNILC